MKAVKIMEYVVKNITNSFIKSNVIEQDDRDKFEYGLIILIEMILDVLGFLIISILFNCTLLMGAFLITFAVVRANAGGRHSKTFIRCFLVSSSVALISVAYVNFVETNLYIYIALLVMSTIIIIRFAPVDSLEKPLSAKLRRICKIRSIVIICIFDIIIAFIFLLDKQSNWINISIIAVVWQSISMLPIFNKQRGGV